MTSASIPVDLINPGQVLASLGFLETADALCSGAVGGFDWTNDADVRFNLRANGDRNPFERVLEFLSKAELLRIAPPGYRDPQKKKGKKDEGDNDSDVPRNDLVHLDCFPASMPAPLALPIRLTYANQSVDITHWSDGSSRNNFKFYAGPRSAAQITGAMLKGTREKPRKGHMIGELKTKGIRTLWEENPALLAERPFHVLTSMGGSFNFDPRGAWTAIEAGYSPNDQHHGVAASPVVEMLAAIGLENARPDVGRDGREKSARYVAWGELLNPLLARPALSGCSFGVSLRRFVFKVGLSGKNKIINFAEEV
jgi:CRISPR-associated protein Csb3